MNFLDFFFWNGWGSQVYVEFMGDQFVYRRLGNLGEKELTLCGWIIFPLL